MATTAQIEANQANAQSSTGPRTEEGKVNSSGNALRHGFTAQTVLLKGEDPAEYDALLGQLQLCFPTGEIFALERAVREMANAEWRLRRARQHQEILVNDRIMDLMLQNPALPGVVAQARAFEDLATNSRAFKLLLRYETKFEAQFNRALRDWTNYRKMFNIGTTPSGVVNLGRPNWVRSEIPKNLTRPPVQTARNAPCPCGSGEKYKRCCGRTAPPVLYPAV